MDKTPVILLIESDSMRLLALADSMRGQGWQVALARDGATAFGAAIRARPDVVVLAASLMGGGARTTLERLRSSVHTAAVPVVVTGCAQADARALREAGAQRTLGPVTTDAEILREVRASLSPGPPPALAPATAVANPSRLQAVESSGLLGDIDDPLLSEMTGLAADMLGAGAVFLSVVAADRQVLTHQAPGRNPLPRQTPLSHSFCQWVVAGREPVMVDDARVHPVLKTNRAIGELGVVAYAGIPFVGSNDEALGSFCAVNNEPRHWGAAELLVLKSFCKVAEARLALRAPGGAFEPGFHRVLTLVGHGISAAGNLMRRLESSGTPAQQAAVAAWIGAMAESLAGLANGPADGPATRSL